MASPLGKRGFSFTVLFMNDAQMAGAGAVGFCDPEIQTIGIVGSQPNDSMQDTFLHETFHAIAHVMGLRETEEEVGIRQDEVEVIGELRPFVSKYGLLVTPIVGVVASGISYRPSPNEIASIFEVPVGFFREAEPIRVDELNRQSEFNLVPAYDFKGFEIWGLTSLIINEFLRVIEAG